MRWAAMQAPAGSRGGGRTLAQALICCSPQEGDDEQGRTVSRRVAALPQCGDLRPAAGFVLRGGCTYCTQYLSVVPRGFVLTQYLSVVLPRGVLLTQYLSVVLPRGFYLHSI